MKPNHFLRNVILGSLAAFVLFVGACGAIISAMGDDDEPASTEASATETTATTPSKADREADAAADRKIARQTYIVELYDLAPSLRHGEKGNHLAIGREVCEDLSAKQRASDAAMQKYGDKLAERNGFEQQEAYAFVISAAQNLCG